MNKMYPKSDMKIGSDIDEFVVESVRKISSTVLGCPWLSSWFCNDNEMLYILAMEYIDELLWTFS